MKFFRLSEPFNQWKNEHFIAHFLYAILINLLNSRNRNFFSAIEKVRKYEMLASRLNSLTSLFLYRITINKEQRLPVCVCVCILLEARPVSHCHKQMLSFNKITLILGCIRFIIIKIALFVTY